MGMPTSAVSGVPATAAWDDSRRAEMLSGLTMGALSRRPRAWPRPRAPSVLADHDVGGLDDRVGRIPDLEPERFHRLVRDRGEDHGAAADVDLDVRGGRTLRDFEDLALEDVAGALARGGLLCPPATFRPRPPDSAGTGRRRLEAEPAQHGSAPGALEQIEKSHPEGRLPPGRPPPPPVR